MINNNSIDVCSTFRSLGDCFHNSIFMWALVSRHCSISFTYSGGFRGGAAVRPHPPEHIFAPPQLLSLLRFLNSNSLTKSIIFIITGWFYVVLSFSLYSYKLWHYIYNNFDRGGTFAGWPEYMYTRPLIVYQNIFEFAWFSEE